MCRADRHDLPRLWIGALARRLRRNDPEIEEEISPTALRDARRGLHPLRNSPGMTACRSPVSGSTTQRNSSGRRVMNFAMQPQQILGRGWIGLGIFARIDFSLQLDMGDCLKLESALCRLVR